MYAGIPAITPPIIAAIITIFHPLGPLFVSLMAYHIPILNGFEIVPCNNLQLM